MRDPFDAGIVWLENSDGRGHFILHEIVGRSPTERHTLQDFDGDLDLLSGVDLLERRS